MIHSHEHPTPFADTLLEGLKHDAGLSLATIPSAEPRVAPYRYVRAAGIALIRFIRPGNVRALKRFGILLVGLGCLAYFIFTAMGGHL